MFWQSKLHLTEQKLLKRYLFHFHKKKDTPQLSGMPLRSSWLLCPPICKSQLLGQSQGKQERDPRETCKSFVAN